jgi:hypothetical protein
MINKQRFSKVLLLCGSTIALTHFYTQVIWNSSFSPNTARDKENSDSAATYYRSFLKNETIFPILEWQDKERTSQKDILKSEAIMRQRQETQGEIKELGLENNT